MKKISPLATGLTLALGAVLLSGCGMFRSQKAWETAQQQSPLEIPPNLNRPSTSAALDIPPPGANQPTANGATASVGIGGGQITDGFVSARGADDAYRQAGQALSGMGQVLSHNDDARSYTVSVVAGGSTQKKRGFISRMFGRDRSSAATGSGGAAHQVHVSITDNGAGASQVRAEGNAAAVSKVMDGLKAALGG